MRMTRFATFNEEGISPRFNNPTENSSKPLKSEFKSLDKSIEPVVEEEPVDINELIKKYEQMIRNPVSVDRQEFKNTKKLLKKNNIDIEILFKDIKNEIDLENQEKEKLEIKQRQAVAEK